MKDITGMKFGRLTAISVNGKTRQGNYTWICLCDCGNKKTVSSGNLLSAQVKSCGCLLKETKTNLTHGDSYSKEYMTWNRVIGRCLNPNNPSYSHYGQRGITVCDRWRNSYENFLHDMGRAPSKNHSIERINVDGNYEPGNCRWATIKEQCNNKTNNRLLSYRGVKKTLAQWADLSGLGPRTIAYSLGIGKDLEYVFNRHQVSINS